MKALEAHPRVRVLWAARREGIDPERVRELCKGARVPIDDDMLAFYARTNGLAMVWAAKDDPWIDPKRHVRAQGLPEIADIEGAARGRDGATHEVELRAIVLRPIEEVIGPPPLRPYTEATRLGFDFPGDYYTPALLARRKSLWVQVGSDHGTFDQGQPEVTFRSYMEAVLATWGSNEWRMKLFGARSEVPEALLDPRTYFRTRPVTLESVLPKTVVERAKAAKIAAAMPADPRLAGLVLAARAATSTSFETQADGRTLLRIVRPDGARQLAFLTPAELASVQRALSED